MRGSGGGPPPPPPQTAPRGARGAAGGSHPPSHDYRRSVILRTTAGVKAPLPLRAVALSVTRTRRCWRSDLRIERSARVPSVTLTVVQWRAASVRRVRRKLTRL